MEGEEWFKGHNWTDTEVASREEVDRQIEQMPDAALDTLIEWCSMDTCR